GQRLMARDHIEHLFSAALDDALTPREQATFDAHLHACTACVDAYARFRASVEALRELPRARMPHPVHLPSTPPVAELRPRWRRLPRAPRPQFRFGGATAIALAGAAVVIAIGLTRPSNTTTTSESGSSAALAPGWPPRRSRPPRCPACWSTAPVPPPLPLAVPSSATSLPSRRATLSPGQPRRRRPPLSHCWRSPCRPAPNRGPCCRWWPPSRPATPMPATHPSASRSRSRCADLSPPGRWSPSVDWTAMLRRLV